MYKNHLVFWIMCWIGPLFLGAQGISMGYWESLSPAVEETESYQLITGEHATALRMNYADSEILNPEDWQILPKTAVPYEVSLVFTRYPQSLESWDVGFDSLLSARFSALEKIAPELFTSDRIQWKIILQTGCNNMRQARECFHGFVIKYAFTPTHSLRENFSLITSFLNQEKDILDTSTVTILKRHPEWDSLTIVTDWTASMYANGSLLLLWMKEKLAKGMVQEWVFFNDGDSLPDSLKLPGVTGGIYAAEEMNWKELMNTILRATLGGSGGDYAENDLEAILVALARRPHPGDLILVADNKSPVRDIALLPEIHVPVRVLVCGSSNGYMHPHYLTIAAHTGGSVHTLYEDIEDFSQFESGKPFQIGKFLYEHENGVYKRIRKVDPMETIWEK